MEKDPMSDRLDELKGNVKAGVGKVTGNERLEASGKTEAATARGRRKTKGVLREGAGSLKEGVGDLLGNERLEVEGKAEKLRGKAERNG